MTTIDPQPSLFDEVRAVRERLTHEAAFAQFVRRHGWFVPRLAELAFDQRARGQRRISVKLLIELVRTEGHGVRIDNSWSSLAARRLVEDYPELDQCIELRKRVSA